MRADLDDAAGGARGVHHRAALHHGVSDGLFHVNVGAGFDGGDHRQRVPVVGRADDDDLGLGGGEEFAVILKKFRRIAGTGRDVFEGGFVLAGIDVAEGDDFAGAARHGFAEDIVAPPTAADERGAEPGAAGFGLGAEGKRKRGEGSRGGGGVEEGAAVHFFWGEAGRIFLTTNGREWTRIGVSSNSCSFASIHGFFKCGARDRSRGVGRRWISQSRLFGILG